MTEGETGPSEGFELLSHPTQMGIVRALFEAHRESVTDRELGFSDLRERVAVEDSGNFSYHLDRITGMYVAGGETARLAVCHGTNSRRWA